ncbi:MAG: hypothetical protein O2887_04405 [Bacteroidetes bacterium]|nr:hypothetical protein [Bacteroidota bacterium]MDA1119727.1 hypothetical protein [Bacteroidota bacterium]
MKSLSIFIVVIVYSISAYPQGDKLVVDPSSLTLEVGEKAKVNVSVVDKKGANTNREVRIFSRDGRNVDVDDDNNVTALKPGNHSLLIISPPANNNDERLRLEYAVSIKFPEIARIALDKVPDKIYVGTTVRLDFKVYDRTGTLRTEEGVTLTSDDKSSVDQYYNLTALKAGTTTITARIGEITNTIKIAVKDNPVVSVGLESDMIEARTGDVFHFNANALDAKGKPIEDAPVTYTFSGGAYDISSSASGLIKQDGRFVAEEAGLYTVTASCGQVTTRMTINAVARDIERDVKLMGHGSVGDRHTSDFWIWEGADGRDYAVTGTWGADGTAYFWDVTNPANITKIDSIQVDARTVNDVKISEDGKLCVISREGASNRKNGIVILDVSDPRDVSVISTFTENLTGGVHNLFIYKNHVYALSNGERYYVINIENPLEPRIVGKFELDTPGHSIHDVWIEDGIAYSSNWQDGVQLVDVGNGIAGGSPENPVQFASYAYPSAAHHATFPYNSKDTGKSYVILGDEIFPYGFNLNGPNTAAGFLHFVDFTDLDNPEEIARFEVPGAGSHNYWVDGDLLYTAFYNGGIRVVDISGELMGDLGKQGREIGFIIPSDPEGYVPNAPFAWGAQLHKGTIFYSDWNSGLWAAKVVPEVMDDVQVETR